MNLCLQAVPAIDLTRVNGSSNAGERLRYNHRYYMTSQSHLGTKLL